MKVVKNLTEGNIYKNFFLFAIPLIAASLLSSMYGTVNAMIAGKYIDNSAMGAVGATEAFNTMISCLFSGFTIGATIHTSRLFGQKDYRGVKRNIFAILSFLVVGILTVSALTLFLHRPLLSFLAIDESILADARTYFLIYVAGQLFPIFNVAVIQILHAVGITNFIFYMSLLSMGLNIGGNLFTVLVLDMGVAGLAVSTVTSAAIVTVLYLLKLRTAFRDMPSERVKIGFYPSMLRATLRYSLPASLQQGVMYLATFFLSPAINVLGPAATTGYAAALRIYNISAPCYQNSSKAVANYVSQSIGAGKTENIPRGLRVGLLQGALLLLPFALGTVIFAKPLASLFFESGYTGEAFAYAVHFSRVYMPLVYLNMLNNLAHSFFRGMGSMLELFVCTLSGSASRLIATVVLAPMLGMEGVFIAWAISWAAEALLCVVLYLTRYRTLAQIEKRIR